MFRTIRAVKKQGSSFWAYRNFRAADKLQVLSAAFSVRRILRRILIIRIYSNDRIYFFESRQAAPKKSGLTAFYYWGHTVQGKSKHIKTLECHASAQPRHTIQEKNKHIENRAARDSERKGRTDKCKSSCFFWREGIKAGRGGNNSFTNQKGSVP